MFEENSVKRLAAELARLTGFPASLVEKDVWQKLVLQELYSKKEAQSRLVFKGGTCITRTLLGYYRFSEDLDFAWNARKPRKFYETFSIRHLAPLGEIGVRIGKHYGTLGGRLMKWDLWCGSEKLVLSANFSHGTKFPIQNRQVSSIKTSPDESKRLSAVHSGVFPAYCAKLAVPCHCPEEIACEKFAAILTRKDLAKPRDLVDLFHLGKIADLRRLSEEKPSVGKVAGMVLSAPSYLSAFNERKAVLPAYLERLSSEAVLEHEIYITPVDEGKLRKFALQTLLPILKRLAEKIEGSQIRFPVDFHGKWKL